MDHIASGWGECYCITVDTTVPLTTMVNMLPMITTLTTSYYSFCILVTVCPHHYHLTNYCSFTRISKYSRITTCARKHHIHSTLRHTNSMCTVHFNTQHNSFNSMSEYPALEETIPKTESFVFLPERSFTNESGRSHNRFKRASKTACISIIVASSDPLSPINFFIYKDSRELKRGP